MENTPIKLSETVMVIDAACLNFVINDLKNYFEPRLQRSLHPLDLALFTVYLAMDAGLKEGDNEVQVLLVYDEQSSILEHCLPCDLKNELDGVAFQDSLGEFCFMAVPSEGLVSRGELYRDLQHIVLDSAEVKKLILVPFYEEYGMEVESMLDEFAKEHLGKREAAKEIIGFRMAASDTRQTICRWELLGYPLMSALGIRSEDL